MADFVDLSVDAKAVEERLIKTSKSISSIRRKFLSKVGFELKKEIQRQIEISYTSSDHTGQLKKGIIYKIPKSGGAYSFQPVERVSVFPGRRVGAKAIAQNEGKKIYSKKTGNFHHDIKGKHFVQTAKAVYLDSGKYQKDVEKIVNDELKKAGLI